MLLQSAPNSLAKSLFNSGSNMMLTRGLKTSMSILRLGPAILKKMRMRICWSTAMTSNAQYAGGSFKPPLDLRGMKVFTKWKGAILDISQREKNICCSGIVIMLVTDGVLKWKNSTICSIYQKDRNGTLPISQRRKFLQVITRCYRIAIEDQCAGSKSDGLRTRLWSVMRNGLCRRIGI